MTKWPHNPGRPIVNDDPEFRFDSEADALATLDELREQRAQLKAASDETLRLLLAAVRAAGALVVDGEPLNRSKIIEHSGLSRRTAYKVLDALPDDPPQADAS